MQMSCDNLVQVFTKYHLKTKNVKYAFQDDKYAFLIKFSSAN